MEPYTFVRRRFPDMTEEEMNLAPANRSHINRVRLKIGYVSFCRCTVPGDEETKVHANSADPDVGADVSHRSGPINPFLKVC